MNKQNPHFGMRPQSYDRGSRQKILLGALGALAIFSVVLHGSTLVRAKPEFQLKAFDQKAFDEGLATCQNFGIRADQTISTTRNNPRFVAGTKATLIKNATLIDGDGIITKGRNVYIDTGIIVSTDYKASVNDLKEVDVWEVEGRFVSPGLVDMHSHAGVDSRPGFWGTSDTNELSDPITSQVRVIDALNPLDAMFERILAGGVTTSLILPGSGNLMGGEAYVIKLRPVESLVVEDMLVQAGITTKPQRWIKMACGENPKRLHKTQINSRLGEAWGFRHRFDQARTLMQKQDHWCAKAASGAQYVAGEEFPSDLELETVVGVLRGDVKIHNHCYEVQDLEMQIRNSKEFGFGITAFHHALDAYKVPELMKENNITVATFANLWGYKKEAFQSSVHAGKILTDHGVALVYKSDHPVTNSGNLIYQAQIGNHFEVPAELAFAAVTSVPATALGLAHRVGYLRPGYDADVLLWNDHPLSLGAYPLQVWVDGATQIDISSKELAATPKTTAIAPKLPKQPSVRTRASCIEGSRAFVLKGIRKSFVHDQAEAQESDILSMTVIDGKVSCYGTELTCAVVSASAIEKGAFVLELNSAYIVPGVTTVAPSLGLTEISSEQSTTDGKVDSSKPEDATIVVSAYDGLVFGGPHLSRAHAMGVLEVITAPSGNFLKGISTAFKTNGKTVVEDGAVVKKAVALHFSIGVGYKEGPTPSVSTQISLLRRILKNNKTKDNIYGSAVNGTIPLVVDADNADEIGHLILLKDEFKDADLVIKGGIEAYMVASELAAAKIPVLLDNHRCMPRTWRTRRCLPGPPLTATTNLQVLHEAGVKVALISNDDGNVGEAYWEASWATKLAGNYTDDEALALISADVREILDLPEMLDSFVIMDGHPLELGSRIAMTVDRGVVATCFPVLP